MGIKTLALVLWVLFLIAIYMVLLTLYYAANYNDPNNSVPATKFFITGFVWVIGGIFFSMAFAVNCDSLAKVGLKTCPLVASRVALIALSIVCFVGGRSILYSIREDVRNSQ